MKNYKKVSLALSLIVSFISCSPEKTMVEPLSKTVMVQETSNQNSIDNKEVETEATSDQVVRNLQTEIRAMKNAPNLTIIMLPKSDLQKSIATLKEAGGKLTYDPNNGHGGSIPFYIAELTPDQINTENLLKSLNLKAASLDKEIHRTSLIEDKMDTSNMDLTNFIPTDSVNISSLGDKKKLGKDITVAVIDSGIDASHPAFGDRVVYWYDGTQETRTELIKVDLNNNKFNFKINEKEESITLTPEMATGEVYAAVMSEGDFTTQLGSDSKVNFLDLNSNKSEDKFLVVINKENGVNKIFFDTNADLKLTSKSEKMAKIDYNTTTKENRNDGMVEFPSRNNILKYPLLLEEEDGKMFIGIGKTNGSHGTHVAGIIAADDQRNNLLGAAPQADLMSLRVCSGLSCSDASIIRGLYKAFYNGKVIPDVVNISLGSHQSYEQSIFSYLFNDLSAKFGTIFFISASNSGPGFRSLNAMGTSGAVVMVGAGVSKKTLSNQYNLPSSQNPQDEGLLYFSSLGPSYTGELKPNIIAPGAAISSTPAAQSYMTQMNGTSMSSPLAAGTFAAILAKVKSADPTLFENINKMREYHQKKSTAAEISLLPYVYAMRDSLQTTATPLKNLSMAQQGYGLIHAGKAAAALPVYLKELNNKGRDYFEIIINDNKKTYDRSLKLKKMQSFELSLAKDGERTKESMANIIATGIDIVLQKVEVLESNGTLKILHGNEMSQFFSIAERGNANNKNLYKTHVTFNNGQTKTFYSRRYIDKMKEGITYIAHYKLMRKGVNISNILDVAHKAITLKEMDLDIPAISISKKETKAGFAMKNIKVGVNNSHRYQFKVTKQMNQINIRTGIKNNQNGLFFIQVYNPDGEKVETELSLNAPIYFYKQGAAKISTIRNGKVQEGIWEVTISTPSSYWLASTTYDLLIEAHLFGIKEHAAKLKLGKDLLIPVQIDGKKLSKVYLSNPRQVIKQQVKVKAFHSSYQPLILPKDYVGELQFHTIDPNLAHWGDISKNLYKKENGQFTPLSKEEYRYDKKSRKFSILKPLTQEVYFSIKTIINFSEEIKSSEVTVETIIESKDDFKIDLSFENFVKMDMAMIVAKGTDLGVKSLGMNKSYMRFDLIIQSENFSNIIKLTVEK